MTRAADPRIATRTTIRTAHPVIEIFNTSGKGPGRSHSSTMARPDRCTDQGAIRARGRWDETTRQPVACGPCGYRQT
jgi:hypothetical protein